MRALKRAVIAALKRAGYYERALGALSGDRALVLVYHRIVGTVGNREWRTGFERGVSASNFERHMEFLRRRMRPVPLAELADAVRRGRSLPERTVCVTFDDGYRDNYTDAFPILRRHGIPATVFVATAYMESGKAFWWDRVVHLVRNTPAKRVDLTGVVDLAGRRGSGAGAVVSLGGPRERAAAAERIVTAMEYLPPERIESILGALRERLGVRDSGGNGAGETMSWSEIEHLSRSGIAIESHTHSHPYLAPLSEKGVELELRRSKECLEQRIGGPVRGVAYPGGRRGMYTEATMRVAKRVGYDFGCVVDLAAVARGGNEFEIRRVPAEDSCDTMLAHKMVAALRRTARDG